MGSFSGSIYEGELSIETPGDPWASLFLSGTEGDLLGDLLLSEHLVEGHDVGGRITQCSANE